MNAKLLLKMIFLIIILLLMVIMGMNNRDSVSFSLPFIGKIFQPAAYMFFGFFAVGLLTGTVLTAGSGKKSGSSGSSKPGNK